MSRHPSRNTSPSTSPKQTVRQETLADPETTLQQTSTSHDFNTFAETPQFTAGHRSRSSPPSTSSAQAPIAGSSNYPDSEAPRIIVTGSPEPRNIQDRTEREESLPRQGRPLVTRHRLGSSSQPPRRSSTPYSRPRSQSQSETSRTRTAPAMSSAASSPGNTSTSGASGSGSNPGYHLPYAPFPYPMPGNGRGQGSNQGSGSGK